MKKLLVILFIISIVSCNQNIIRRPYPKGDLISEKITFEFAIYILNDNDYSLGKVREYIENSYNVFNIVQSPDETNRNPQIVIKEINNVHETYAVPDKETLKIIGYGLNENTIEKLLKTNRAYIFDFYFFKENSLKNLKTANELIYNLGNLIDGVLWDEETRECFTIDYWKNKRIDSWLDNSPNIKDHITIHYYQSGDLYREITLGMAKFGLSDVVVNELSANSSDSISSMINLVCQTMLEKGHIEKEGTLEINIDNILNDNFRNSLNESVYENAKKKGSIKVGIGIKEEGDPENSLLELIFANYFGGNIQINQNKLIALLFGSIDDISLITHDQKILELSNIAKKKLPGLKRAFTDGFKPGEFLLVKLPFPYGNNNNEWMWVEVIQWNNKEIIGILQNDPYYINNLKAGSQVNKYEDDIFDYIFYHSDGTSEGNETGKYMLAQENQD